MASKLPLVLSNGEPAQLAGGDTLPSSIISPTPLSTISLTGDVTGMSAGSSIATTIKPGVTLTGQPTIQSTGSYTSTGLTVAALIGSNDGANPIQLYVCHQNIGGTRLVCSLIGSRTGVSGNDIDINRNGETGGMTVHYTSGVNIGDGADPGVGNISVAGFVLSVTGQIKVPAAINLAFQVNSVTKMQLYASGGLFVGVAGSDPGIGNIGLGAISTTALESSVCGLLIGNSQFIATNTIGVSNVALITQNAAKASGGVFKYISTDKASYYFQSTGVHAFLVAPSGTAGTNIAFSIPLQMDATRVTAAVPIQKKSYTVAALPTGVFGDCAIVSDALAPTFGATVVGGGAIKVPVYSDGTNWKVG